MNYIWIFFYSKKIANCKKHFTRVISSNINECDMPNSFSGRSGSKIIHHFITNTHSDGRWRAAKSTAKSASSSRSVLQTGEGREHHQHHHYYYSYVVQYTYHHHCPQLPTSPSLCNPLIQQHAPISDIIYYNVWHSSLELEKNGEKVKIKVRLFVEIYKGARGNNGRQEGEREREI